MKYRELTPNEIEAYNIGYKVGNRQTVITDIEWESEEEHKIYRKGYMAGLMDYKRNVSNVSNVSNVDIVTPITPITPTTPIGIRNSIRNKGDISNKGGMGEKEKEGGKQIRGSFVMPTLEEILTYAKQMNDTTGMGGFACSKQTAIDFFNQYDRQGWVLGNGNHMTNWKSGLRRWADQRYQFTKPDDEILDAPKVV